MLRYTCPECWALSYELRPEGQTYGDHLPDCALPLRHESFCKPGGAGHPRAPKIRGYWPVKCRCGHIDFPHVGRVGACEAEGCVCDRFAPADGGGIDNAAVAS